MIDMEKLLTVYLKAETGQKVVAETPEKTTTAWIRLVLLDVADRTLPSDHLLNYFFQLDCYASGNGPGVPNSTFSYQQEAGSIARAARAALLAMPSESFTDAVITNVLVRGPRRMPDTEFETTRQRYILEAEVFAHVSS